MIFKFVGYNTTLITLYNKKYLLCKNIAYAEYKKALKRNGAYDLNMAKHSY